MKERAKPRLIVVYELLAKRKKMTALDVENMTKGVIQQSDGGHLLRELVACGNATRNSTGKGRGAPFVYTFINGTPPPKSKWQGRLPVKPVAKRDPPEKNVVAERSHKATPEGVLLLDAITSSWGACGFDEQTT